MLDGTALKTKGPTQLSNTKSTAYLGSERSVSTAATCQDDVLRQEYLNMCSASWWHRIMCGIFESKKNKFVLFAYVYGERRMLSI